MNYIPPAYRRTVQFCGNVMDLNASRNDIPLKPNVAFILQQISSAQPTEDLIEAAQSKATMLEFNAVKIDNRYAALAVILGVK